MPHSGGVFRAQTDAGVEFIVDPTGHFQEVKPNKLLDACGFIPSFIDFSEEKALFHQLLDNYGFGFNEMVGCTVTHTQTMLYPGDPELFPLMATSRQSVKEVPQKDCNKIVGVLMTEHVIIFQHGIVAVQEVCNGETRTTVFRMD